LATPIVRIRILVWSDKNGSVTVENQAFFREGFVFDGS
jgi:hypothetical protein